VSGRDGGAPTVERAADEGETPPTERPISRRRGFRLSFWGGLVALVLAGLALLAVLPTRAWLAQRRQFRDGTEQLAEIQARNTKLQEQLAHIQSPEAVDEVARERLGLVRPTEKALAVLPAPTLTMAALPARWPYTLLQQLATARG
jgi:cell division protein FtsB